MLNSQPSCNNSVLPEDTRAIKAMERQGLASILDNIVEEGDRMEGVERILAERVTGELEERMGLKEKVAGRLMDWRPLQADMKVGEVTNHRQVGQRSFLCLEHRRRQTLMHKDGQCLQGFNWEVHRGRP